MENYDANVSVATGQFLNYLNVCGRKLGYPFLLYSNGECGKKLVSSDSKHNAVAKVFMSCGVTEMLQTSAISAVEHDTIEASGGEDFLRYLNKCAPNIGFPFVILTDGRILKSSFLTNEEKKMVVVKVLRAFVNDAKLLGVVEDVSLKEKCEKSDTDEAFLELKAIIDDDDLERFEKLRNFNHQMKMYILTNASQRILIVFLHRCKPNTLNPEEFDLLWSKNNMEELLDAYFRWVSGK